MNLIEYEKLRTNDMMKRKSDAFINNILSIMPVHIKEESKYVKVRKNAVILEKSSAVNRVCITISGEISVVNEFESGKIFEPVVIYHSDFIGVVEIVLKMKEYISTNIAKTQVELISIPKDTFIKWIDNSHQATKLVLISVSSNFKKNMTESGESVLLDSMFLFVSHLLKNASLEKKHDVYLLHETRERSSIRTGINLRTLYRHVKKLKEDGYIHIVNRQIGFNETQKDNLYKYYLALRNK